MGHHFVPQRHLRRFECPDKPGSVWMYDKERKTFSQVGIRNAAQSRDYYDSEVETSLADDIEVPGSEGIDKLICGEALDTTERKSVALYLFTMATRGPRERRKMIEKRVPQALDEVIAEHVAAIQAKSDEIGGHPNTEQVIAKVRAAGEKFAKQLPANVIKQIRTPYSSENTVGHVYDMTWRIVPVAPTELFVTCDTPMHFSEWSGVGSFDSEVTFPITKDLVLMGSFVGEPATVKYLAPIPNLSREMNVRMVNCAERFVFSHVKEDWIAEIADNPPPSNRFQWLESD